jgi:CHAD domain-containing protein
LDYGFVLLDDVFNALVMKEVKKDTFSETVQSLRSPTLGEYAHQIISEQFQQMVKQEKKVLADKDPEPLHRMRVATRRLRTALHVFAPAITIPEIAGERHLRSLARLLGKLRDLDVQMADLTNSYRPEVRSREQKLLDKAIKGLKQQRRKVFSEVEAGLERSRYQTMKSAYQTWLEKPQYMAIAQLPLAVVLPDLLSPLLSMLLLHSGWLISTDNLSEENSHLLHDLRKACKHARYQAEFFTDFYGEGFHQWIDEVKVIQEQLGKVQDTQVLQSLLATELPKVDMPDLQAMIQLIQAEALVDWDRTRDRYLVPDRRQELYQLILKPSGRKEAQAEISNGALAQS